MHNLFFQTAYKKTYASKPIHFAVVAGVYTEMFLFSSEDLCKSNAYNLIYSSYRHCGFI